MKKILLVAAILVAVLALLALPKGQAGPGKGKPIRWKATFIADDNANLKGMIGNPDYVGGVDGVNINNGSGTCDNGNVYSFLMMGVWAPSYLKFNMDGFLSSGNDDSAPCGFPNTIGLTWPACLQYFLNSYLHPTTGYQYVYLTFTTNYECQVNIPNLMDMPLGSTLPARMCIYFFSHYWDCPQNHTLANYNLYNLMMHAHGYNTDRLLGDLDIYIKRISPTEWIASVDTEFDNPDYPNLPNSNSANFAQDDGIVGQYATCTPSSTKRGKASWTTEYHYPWAKAPLKFQIKFTKY